MEVDWDLQAVVRGCAMTNSSSVENPLSTLSTLTHEQEDHFSFPIPSENRTVLEELDELYKPFFPNFRSLSTQTIPTSISSSLEGFKEKKQQTIQQHQQKFLTGSSTSAPVFSHSQTPRSKKRKNQQKKVVCHVSAEGLSSDLWAWRKYGQKPIKGSPYPRGYYRCSSSKGCLARKQVEKSRSDPNMFIITYTAEHNHPIPTHRNSLAGSTRQKLSDIGADKTITKPSEDDLLLKMKKEEKEEEEIVEEEEQIDELLMPDMEITEDLFMGTEQFAGPVFDDSFSDHFPANFSSIWATNKAETATGLS